MNNIIIYTAKYLVFIIPLIAFVYWLTLARRQKLQMIFYGVITLVVTFVLTRIGSALYYDPRPFTHPGVIALLPHAADNGFPSDHTALAASVAVATFLMNKKLGSLLMILAVLVGLSRVAAHVHSPIDIIGSIIFAGIGGLVAYYTTALIMKRIYKPKSKLAVDENTSTSED